MMKSIFDAGEMLRTDEGVQVQVIEVLNYWQARVGRTDTGEITIATARRRTFPKADPGGCVKRLAPGDVGWQ